MTHYKLNKGDNAGLVYVISSGTYAIGLGAPFTDVNWAFLNFKKKKPTGLFPLVK